MLRGLISTVFAGAGARVGRLSVDLQRRIGRRDLLDLAGEARQDGFDLLERRAGRRWSRRSCPSASSVSVSSPNRIVKSYALVASSIRPASLVASPSAIGSTPLASGSSVPPWPTLVLGSPASRSRRLTALTACGRAEADRLVEDDPAVEHQVAEAEQPQQAAGELVDERRNDRADDIARRARAAPAAARPGRAANSGRSCANAPRELGGSRPSTTWPPSNGGTGSRLNTARKRLIRTKLSALAGDQRGRDSAVSGAADSADRRRERSRRRAPPAIGSSPARRAHTSDHVAARDCLSAAIIDRHRLGPAERPGAWLIARSKRQDRRSPNGSTWRYRIEVVSAPALLRGRSPSCRATRPWDDFVKDDRDDRAVSASGDSRSWPQHRRGCVGGRLIPATRPSGSRTARCRGRGRSR